MHEDTAFIEERLHRQRVWARDLALVGAVTMLPLAVTVSWKTALLAAAFSALGGALLGALVPRLLHRHVRRFPLLLLAPAGVGLGALWGAAAALPAAVLGHSPEIRTVELAATVGAAQLGWLWIPHAVRLARRRASWPTLIAAAVAAPLVAWLAYVHVTW